MLWNRQKTEDDMTRSRTTALICAATFGLWTGLWSTTALSGPVSEQDAVLRALQTYPSIEAARAAMVAAEGFDKAAGFWFPDNPSIMGDYLTDKHQSNIGKREWNAEISVPLWIAGQQGLRQDLADTRIREAHGYVSEAQWSLSQLARTTYWRLWLSRELLKAAEERAARARELERITDARQRVREIAGGEAAQVKAEILADYQALEMRRGEMAMATAALAELTGVPAAAIGALDSPQPTAPKALSGPDPENRPDVIRRKQTLEMAKADLDLRKREAWPNPELTVGVRSTQDDTLGRIDRGLRVGMRIPLTIMNFNQQAIGESGAQMVRAEADYRMGVLNAERQTAQTLSAWQSAWDRWQYATKALSYATEAFNKAQRSFQVGESNATDLIWQKRLWTQALENERTAHAEAFMAQRDYEAAIGGGIPQEGAAASVPSSSSPSQSQEP